MQEVLTKKNYLNISNNETCEIPKDIQRFELLNEYEFLSSNNFIDTDNLNVILPLKCNLISISEECRELVRNQNDSLKKEYKNSQSSSFSKADIFAKFTEEENLMHFKFKDFMNPILDCLISNKRYIDDPKN
ncbi:hypothetical protein RF11_14192 [Thelohanellus kitauei]|uniref:Uncharacterized protein n=1 Tax=Thelohanellus kitauei TaxID=669202 RepID=A0A0C2NBQ2_THEKT|nr:hypothetical protein RF11_14192 [Thelohanellus kitauei]